MWKYFKNYFPNNSFYRFVQHWSYYICDWIIYNQLIRMFVFDMYEYGKYVIHIIIWKHFWNLRQLIGKLIYETTPTQNRMNHGTPPGTTAPIASLFKRNSVYSRLVIVQLKRKQFFYLPTRYTAWPTFFRRWRFVVLFTNAGLPL